MKMIKLIIYLNLFFSERNTKNVIINLRNFILRNKIVKNYIFTSFYKKKKGNVFFDENINNYIKTNSLIWRQKRPSNINVSKILFN